MAGRTFPLAPPCMAVRLGLCPGHIDVDGRSLFALFPVFLLLVLGATARHRALGHGVIDLLVGLLVVVDAVRGAVVVFDCVIDVNPPDVAGQLRLQLGGELPPLVVPRLKRGLQALYARLAC